MLLDPAKTEADWLVALRREAEAVYGADRLDALGPTLQRLSRALTCVAGLDARSIVATGDERPTREARHG